MVEEDPPRSPRSVQVPTQEYDEFLRWRKRKDRDDDEDAYHGKGKGRGKGKGKDIDYDEDDYHFSNPRVRVDYKRGKGWGKGWRQRPPLTERQQAGQMEEILCLLRKQSRPP